MKLIALRIGEEEKARLEQLAERRNVTLSRALREGAALYLDALQAKAHEAKGGNATLHGVRRGKSGNTLNKPSLPTQSERRRVRRLKEALHDRALSSIRDAWELGEKPAVVLAAIAGWLSIVGEVYGSNPGEAGWDWFLRDYCPEYSDSSARAALRKELRAALFTGTTVNVGTLLDALSTGFLRLVDDAENQELVRRSILPTWQVLDDGLVG
jgi:hypothetical protein